MFKMRLAMLSVMALSFWTAAAVAQDAGQWLILHARYGTERKNADVTQRLKELARADRPFRVDNDSMGGDPIYGQPKVLRVFARGPNGDERWFDFPEWSMFDGAQFRGWGRGEWGDEHWRGGWNGRRDHDESRRDHDEGEFLILSAQYGTGRRHVDVTQRLKEIARHDVTFRLDNRIFGVDPAEGRPKVLRIYARDPNGHERMFEYAEGSMVDGAQFRAWGRGEWGGDNDHWSGRWEGEEHDRH